jgi:MurNAc alpha-1-phosphate uridylyltransferase
VQCVILAGGLGTRMWPEAQRLPKTLLPVAGRPFADWQLGWLAGAGVTSVVYCIGYLGDQVRDHVGDGSRWGLEVEYVDEGPTLRGTAGALRLAADSGVLAPRFLVLYGDSWLQVDPAEVHRASERSERPALMSVFENLGRWDTSNVVYDEGRVVRYAKGLDPVPEEMRWIDYGLSVFTRDLVVERVPLGAAYDLAPLCADLAAAGELSGFLATERFYEIGSPEGLAEVEALLRDRSLRRARQP